MKLDLKQIAHQPGATLPFEFDLDLSGLEFMDSSGIAVVVQTARKCAAYGGLLAVSNTPPQAKNVLLTAGIHRLVDIC